MEQLTQLLPLLERIDVEVGDGAEASMLRRQAARLWQALCSGVFPLAKR